MQLVYIHLGQSILPDYINISIEQAKKFNNDDIYVIANKNQLDKVTGVNKIPVEDLIDNRCKNFEEVADFMKRREKALGDFWFVTAQRFSILESFMAKYNKKNVIHMEYDNVLYINLEQYKDVFMNCYKDSVAVCPVASTHVGASLMYVDSFISLEFMNDRFVEILLETSNKKISEMEVLKTIVDKYPKCLKLLPVLPYMEGYNNNIELFNSVFDGLPYGQFVGGINKRIMGGSTKPGKDSIWPNWIVGEELRKDEISIEWKTDNQNRRVPLVCRKEGLKMNINNLHIHSKKLHEFIS